MAKMTTDELLGVFEEMTVLELKEFLDAFEEKFDVTAAAPVAVLLHQQVEEMTQEQEKKKILLMLFLQMQDHKRYKLSKKLEA